MNLAIYADILNNIPTGIENYTINLIKNIPSEITLIHHKYVKNLLFSKHKEFILNRIWRYPFSRTIDSIINPIKTNFDIIHCPTISIPFTPRNKEKLIITVHDLIPITHPKYHNLRRIIYFNFFLKKVLNRADKIIAVSNNTKNDIIKLFKLPKSKIKVIYNGVDEKFKPTKDTSVLDKYNITEEYILFVGTLEPRKNLDRLIQAYNSLHTKEKLVVVGRKGWDYKKLLKHKNIHFTDYVEDKDLPALYSQAKLFIYPSLYEGFGLPVLEAMACGCPVVTSNISSLPEVAGEAAFLVNPFSVENISQSMNKLLNNPKLRKELSEKGLQQAKKFSWKQCAEETYQLYNEVYNENSTNK